MQLILARILSLSMLSASFHAMHVTMGYVLCGNICLPWIQNLPLFCLCFNDGVFTIPWLFMDWKAQTSHSPFHVLWALAVSFPEEVWWYCSVLDNETEAGVTKSHTTQWQREGTRLGALSLPVGHTCPQLQTREELVLQLYGFLFVCLLFVFVCSTSFICFGESKKS